MKYFYLIEKYRYSPIAYSSWVPHEIFIDKKRASSRCDELKKKARKNEYRVTKVLNGGFTEFFYDGK